MRIYYQHALQSPFLADVIDILEMNIWLIRLGLAWDKMIVSFDEDY